ncbi:hypothetical protein F4680DRAFT_12715 [Xylaria scruposa]|nr:hypothetical protein F4680DRAFT_12715 [Xylaria scruposa]
MFRSSMHRALAGGAGLRTNGFPRLTPIVMRRNICDGDSEKTDPPSSGGPSQAKPKPQRERAPIDLPFARWSSAMDPRPLYQDVRDNGPLFRPSKMELDSDPEVAKQQWRNLCVEQEQKQKVANELWNQKKELEVRCHCTEAENIRIRDALTAASQKKRILKANNAHLQEVLALTTRTCKSLGADNESLQARCKDVEAKLKETRDVLHIVSQAHKRLETKNARLAAEAQLYEQCAAGRPSWAELRDCAFLVFMYVALGLFPFVILYSLFLDRDE